jgi:Trypsin-like peptidase domain
VVGSLLALSAPSVVAEPDPNPAAGRPKSSTKSPPALRCDVVGTKRADHLVARKGKVVCGRRGDDRILARRGGVVYGGPGADRIASKGGTLLYGEGGADKFCTRNGATDLVFGGPGSDSIRRDRAFDASKLVERQLGPGACSGTRLSRSPGSVRAGVGEHALRTSGDAVDMSPLTRRSKLSDLEAQRFWSDKDVSGAKPIPLPAVAEPISIERFDGLQEAHSEASEPQATKPRLPRALDEELIALPMIDQGWFRHRLMGHLYVWNEQKGKWVGNCSGTLVARDVVLTAAHCVYNGGWLVSDPSHNLFRLNQWGNDRDGQWIGWSSTIHTVWANSGSRFYPVDYAFIRLRTGDDGTEAGDVHGWAGIVSEYVSDMWSLGYPGTGIFFSQWGGDYPYYCYSRYGGYSTWNWGGNPYYDIGMGCTMTGGSSGGPWFTSYNGSWAYVASVNSHCWNTVMFCKDWWSETMWGPYFTQETINLLNAAKAS